MNDNNNNNEDNVSLFDMYGVDQKIKHPEPMNTVPTPTENEETEEQVVETEQVSENNNEEVNENTSEINSLSDINNEEHSSSEEQPYEDNAEVSSRLNVIEDDVDEELLEFFIGDAYPDYRTKGFNIGAFFFGATYFLYRKMVLYGIGIMFLSGALSVIPGIRVFSYAIPFVTGIFGNQIYFNFAKKKVKGIVENNSDLSRDDLINLCRKSGGTSLLYALFPLGLVIIVLIIIGMLISAAGAASTVG